MNLLIDVGAIKTGGGAQLALNFLDLLVQEKHHQKRIILIPKTGPLAKFKFDQQKFTVYFYPSNYVARFWFECTELRAIVKKHAITHFYTFLALGFHIIIDKECCWEGWIHEIFRLSTRGPVFYSTSAIWKASATTTWKPGRQVCQSLPATAILPEVFAVTARGTLNRMNLKPAHALFCS